MWELIVRPDAELDLQEAYQWYEKKRIGLGNSFLLNVEAALKSIRSNPLLSTLIYKTIRRKLLHRFPYGIFYTTTENQIIIIAVMHVKRCPKHWKNSSF